VLDPEIFLFRPLKWPQKFRNQKIAKHSKLPENSFEPVGIGGWPMIFTWINSPFLGRNGLDYVEYLGEMEKCLLNLHLNERLALLENLRCLAC
jgi:hypothetical protein